MYSAREVETTESGEALADEWWGGRPYCRQRQLVHRLVDQVKTEYLSRMVNEAEGDQKGYFSGIIKKYFQHQPEPILPSHEGHQELEERFAVFFQKKIDAVYSCFKASSSLLRISNIEFSLTMAMK